MIRPARIISTLLFLCLVTTYISGQCADTNADASIPPINMLDQAQPTVAGSPLSMDTNDLTQDFTRKLSPNDTISMTVYQEDDLATKTIIDKNGMVMLPLLGQVKIGGLTVVEATEHIQQLYNKDYLVNPRVNLIVDQFAELHFVVLGQVQHPGSFDFPQNGTVNLLEAIAIAGGYTRLGAQSEVEVRRTEGGSPKIYHLNAEEMSKDSQKTPFKILPDDIITVGERTF